MGVISSIKITHNKAVTIRWHLLAVACECDRFGTLVLFAFHTLHLYKEQIERLCITRGIHHDTTQSMMPVYDIFFAHTLYKGTEKYKSIKLHQLKIAKHYLEINPRLTPHWRSYART